jgi:acyl dehydratase
MAIEHRALATRPGWRMLSLRGEGFDSRGDKVLEFDSAVLVQVEFD